MAGDDTGGSPGSAGDGPQGGSRAGGGAEPEAPVSLVRQALEAAWVVARAGAEATPPVPPPPRMRPIMSFAKLGERSLATVRACLQEDPEFRQRVAAALDAGAADRASWLWLSRPPGWEEDFVELVRQAEEARRQAHDHRAESSARRRLAAAEAAVARLERAGDEAARLAAERLEDLGRERAARRAAEEAAESLAGRVETQEAESRARAAEATAARSDAEAALRRAEAAEAALAAAESRAREAEAATERLAAEIEALRQGPVAGAGTGPAGDLAAASRSVGDAARAALALGRALERLAGDLAGGPPGGDAGAGSPSPAGSTGAGPRAAGAPIPPPAAATGSRSGAAAPRLRRPVRLPPGVFDDSVEAASYLLRRQGVVLIVDGYNVSLSTWPNAGLEAQRDRLVAALSALAARTGASVQVVFDGSAEERLIPLPGRHRQAVRVAFSPTGEDADEVIIAMVDAAPPARSMVVATDDRRLRAEVARRGANTISVAQLLASVARRDSGG